MTLYGPLRIVSEKIVIRNEDVRSEMQGFSATNTLITWLWERNKFFGKWERNRKMKNTDKYSIKTRHVWYLILAQLTMTTVIWMLPTSWILRHSLMGIIDEQTGYIRLYSLLREHVEFHGFYFARLILWRNCDGNYAIRMFKTCICWDKVREVFKITRV